VYPFMELETNGGKTMISDLQSATFVLGIINSFVLFILLSRNQKKNTEPLSVSVEKDVVEPFSVAIGGIEKTITEYPYVWDFKITTPGIYKITINTKELTN